MPRLSPAKLLKQCETLEHLLEFTEHLKPKIGSSGGRRFVFDDSKESICLNEITHHLQNLYHKSLTKIIEDYKKESGMTRIQLLKITLEEILKKEEVKVTVLSTNYNSILEKVENLDEEADKLLNGESTHIKLLTQIRTFWGIAPPHPIKIHSVEIDSEDLKGHNDT